MSNKIIAVLKRNVNRQVGKTIILQNVLFFLCLIKQYKDSAAFHKGQDHGSDHGSRLGSHATSCRVTKGAGGRMTEERGTGILGIYLKFSK